MPVTTGPAPPVACPPTRAPGRPRAAYGLLFASLLVGAAAPPFYKFASGLPPLELAFWISLAGTAASSAVLAVHPGVRPFRIYREDRGQLAVLFAWSFGSFTLVVIALSAGTHVLSASLAAILYRTWPLMLGLLVWPVLGERLGIRDWLGLTIGFLGVLGAYALAGSVVFPSRDLPIVGLLLLGALGDAVAAVFSRQRKPANMASFVFGCNAIALAVFAALGGAAGVLDPGRLTAGDVVAIVFLGGVQNVGLTVLFIESYDRVAQTGPVALVYLASPFLTFAFDYLFLGEPVLPVYWLIAVGVAAGGLVMGTGRRSVLGRAGT